MSKLTERTQDQLVNGSLNLQMAVPQPTPVPVTPVQFPTSIPVPHKVKKTRERKVNAPQIAPVVAPAPLKVAMVGTAPSSRMLAPYNDPTWKIWGCSPGNMNQLPRVDAWIEVHGTNLLEPENKGYAAQYIDWMSKLQCPLYMQDQRIIPHALTIPKDELVAEFGPYFFTSTFTWMIGMALMAGAKEIMLFGIDMASRDEYIIQRPGAYFFFSEAARRGCRITAPYESDIMQPPGLYGYSDVSPYGRKLRARRDELRERIAPMEQQIAKLTQDCTYLKGALEDNDYMLSIQGGVQDNSSTRYLDKLLESKTETGQPVSVSLPSQG